MKIGQFIHILAILLLIISFIPPVLAAENETGDAATAFYNSGVLLLEEKEYARAIAAFDQALASNTTMIRWSDALLYTYQNKAYALIQLNNFSSAVQTIDQGLAIYGNDETLWYNKGFALFKLENYPDAIASYDKVLLINNKSVPALLNNMGDTYFQMGRYQDAVDSYLRANAIEPGNAYSAARPRKGSACSGNCNASHHHPPPDNSYYCVTDDDSTTPVSPTEVPTRPTKTQAPLSLLPVVAALSLLGVLSVIVKKR